MSLKIWIAAARPPTLSAAVVPVLVGTAAAVAEGLFRPLVFLAALVAALLIQVASNLSNDLFDFRKGVDTSERLGPTRVTQAGLLSQREVAVGTVVAVAGAVLAGAYLVSVGGWPILLIGVTCVACGILYTGGPWPLGYHGLGEATCFLCFGVLAVTGTYYLHAGSVSSTALAASIPVGCLVTAILVVNNLRDISTDRVAGKYTLAVLIGEPATRRLYLALLAVAYVFPLWQLTAGAGGSWFWLPWLTLPLGVALARRVLQDNGRALNRSLRRTSLLHLLFGVLLGAAFLVRL